MLSVQNHSYWYFYWLYALTAFLCLLQFFRPTVAGWGVIICAYVLFLVNQLYWLAAQLYDFYKFRGADHSAFEGWDSVITIFSIATVLAFVLAAVVSHFPKVGALAS